MDNNTYLFKISGSIGSAKHKEFEQTIRFVFNMLPFGCFSSHLALDVFCPDHYHLFTIWRTADALSAFKQSDEFNIIRGSFQALGTLDESVDAELTGTQTFRISTSDP